MTASAEFKPLGLEDLFKFRIEQGRDADALKVAECIMDSVHQGFWQRAATRSGTKLGSSQALRAEFAVKLKGQVPLYNQFPKTSAFLLREIMRGWAATDDQEQEKKLADEFLFSRLEGWPQKLEEELVDRHGTHTLQKVYRIFARLTSVQIYHNALTVGALAKLISTAHPEHLIAIGKIFEVGNIDAHFVEFRLPEVVQLVKQIG